MALKWVMSRGQNLHIKVYEHLNFKRNVIMLEGPCLNGEAKSVQMLTAK
jgi:hypothetical protein